MQEQMEKGLRYFCDERYQPGHRCNRPKIYLLEGMGVEEEPRIEENAKEILLGDESDDEVEEDELLGFSLHALAEASAPQTMRVMGRIKSQVVVVLIDTGSTHSFMDPNVAKNVNLLVQNRDKLTIMVANGATLPYQGYCPADLFSLQGYSFNSKLHLLAFGGCDLVLEIDWLRTLGPILWDFVALTMKFTLHQRKIQLQGLIPSKNMLDDGVTIPKANRTECKGIWLQMIGEKLAKHKTVLHPTIQELVEKFNGIFKEPKGLSPSRSHDHQIILQEGAKPTCVRPYR
jgi:hypothetical protein